MKKILLILVLFFCSNIHADEQLLIRKLLNHLENSDVIFFTNQIPYSPKEARNQLESSLIRSGITILTAEDFIHKIATRSYITGHKYYIKTEKGEKLEASNWFSNALKKIRRGK